MTQTQKNYIKTRLTIAGAVGAFIIAILGICYDSLIIQGLIGLASLGFLGYVLALAIGEIVYRWRVMGATADNEQQLFDRYWFFVIKRGIIDDEIEDILSGNSHEDWSEESKAFVVGYLQKINEVKIPKILTI